MLSESEAHRLLMIWGAGNNNSKLWYPRVSVYAKAYYPAGYRDHPPDPVQHDKIERAMLALQAEQPRRYKQLYRYYRLRERCRKKSALIAFCEIYDADLRL